MALSCIKGVGECNGCGRCNPEPTAYYCTVCHKEVYADDDIYLDEDGFVVGCVNCLTVKKADDVLWFGGEK